MNDEAEAKVRQVRVPEALYLRVLHAAALEQADSGKRVSVVGWIRSAIEQRLDRAASERRVPPAGQGAGR